MLQDQILATLQFFDLQDYPLTLLELEKFLIANVDYLKTQINPDWEYVGQPEKYLKVSAGQILQCLNSECAEEVEKVRGFYSLKGRKEIIYRRLDNYLYGIFREKLVRRFINGLRHVPFVRGVALAGSQALGQQGKNSDIDLLIILDEKFLWLGRTLVTAYFQILGKRRHGKNIANRFCLNHYLAGVKEIEELRNLYTAIEYAKLRPLVYEAAIAEFQQKNCYWIQAFLPNFSATKPSKSGNYSHEASSVQKIIERGLASRFGQWLEQKLKNWQLPKIRQEEFILVREDELSFHPDSKQRELLQKFFSERY